MLLDGRGKHPAPAGKRPAHAQGPGDVAVLVFLGHGHHAFHEIGVQRLHVGFADACVGRIRHGRVQRTAVFDDAMADCFIEVLEAIVTESGFIRGDIGGIDRPDRCFHRQAAGEGFAVLGGVAGHAVAGTGKVLALLDQVLISVCSVDRAANEQRQRSDNY
ncbi:hypothetical protein D3C85_1472300 [compost metagenome]